MDIAKTGQLIAKARKEKGMTQEELGTAIYRTAGAVSKWERGLSFPDVFILEALARRLDLSLIDLLQGEKHMDNQILVNEAEQRMRDVLLLFSDDFAKDRTPESIRRFLAPKTWQQLTALIFLLIGTIHLITGTILFFTIEFDAGLLISGSTTFLLALIFSLWDLLYSMRKKKIIKNGIALTAIVTKVALCRFVSISFQKSIHPYQIFFEYALNEQTYKGKSLLIWERPELQTKELKIFIDPKHPRRYCLDL